MALLPIELIRMAVNSGEFGRAQLLWVECVAGLKEDLSAGRLTEATLSDVRELVDWSRTVVSCARAHLQDRLNNLHVAGEYEFPAPPVQRSLVDASF